MADPTTPVIPTTDQAKAALESAEKTAEQLKEGIVSLGGTLEGAVKTAFNEFSKIGGDTITKFKGVGKVILENNALFDQFTKGYVAFRSVTQTNDLFTGLSGSTAVFGTITDQISQMGAEWSKLATALPFGGGEMVKSLALNASYGQKAETQMISMLAAGGGLGKMFDDNGNIIGDLSTKTLKYVNTLGEVAEANGMTIASVIKYGDELNRIPGVMQENINMGEALGGDMSALNAAMKVMVGSGQNISEVMGAMRIAYENLSNPMGAVEDKGKKGLSLFATMSSLSKDLNLQFSETSGFLGDIAKQFKFVGDNTEAAAKVMSRFTDALRNTGLTSGASLEVIKGMVKSVGELSIGTKAFVSARSGGPGGLQGAVQIDKLNREGKSDQVMNMVLSTLKQQFGGKIYTQAEGAQSQEAAAQFTKQKMMLQSGAFGNLVGSGPGADEKATRLLEALSTGDTGKAAKVGQQALEAVGKQGNSLQQETNTVLNKVALSSERTAIATQLTALKDFRQYLGSGNDFAKTTMNKDMLNAGALTSNQEKRDLTTEVKSQDWDNQFREVAKKGAKDLLDGLKISGSGASAAVGDVRKRLGDGGKAMMGLNQLAEDERVKKQITDNTPAISMPVQRGQLTRAANPQIQMAAVQATTRAVASNTNVNVEHHLKVDISDEAKKLINIQSTSTTTARDESGNIVKNLNNRNEPGF